MKTRKYKKRPNINLTKREMARVTQALDKYEANLLKKKVKRPPYDIAEMYREGSKTYKAKT